MHQTANKWRALRFFSACAHIQSPMRSQVHGMMMITRESCRTSENNAMSWTHNRARRVWLRDLQHWEMREHKHFIQVARPLTVIGNCFRVTMFNESVRMRYLGKHGRNSREAIWRQRVDSLCWDCDGHSDGAILVARNSCPCKKFLPVCIKMSNELEWYPRETVHRDGW